LHAFDPRFVSALKPGGKLFVIVGDAPAMDARVVTRLGDNDWETDSLFETVLTPLENAGKPAEFLF